MILNKHFLGTFFRREDPESPYYNLINAVHEKMVDIDRNTSHKEKFDQIIATIILDDAWSSGNSALRLTIEYMPDTYSVLVNLHNAEDRLVYAAKTRKNEWIAPLNES
ncbi:hypothetical protein [Xanthomonas phage JGB6]|nr:hypothetical protein [Xanthomonas phage JGB6]